MESGLAFGRPGNTLKSACILQRLMLARMEAVHWEWNSNTVSAGTGAGVKHSLSHFSQDPRVAVKTLL